MRRAVILDTGPLVAALNERDAHHGWAKSEWSELDAPLLTCEAVIAEACHILRKTEAGPRTVLELIRRGAVSVPFVLEAESTAVGQLMKRYASVPMSFADACLVRMAEQHEDSRVLTLDRGFRIFRKQGRRVVPTILPPER